METARSNRTPRKAHHPESELQRACVEWFNWKQHQLKGLLFAVPNGGARRKVEASIMKAEGVVSGVADLLLLVPNKSFHGMCIEMKTPKGTQSDSQKWWQEKAESQGYYYVICRSRDEFVKIVETYLNDR